MAQTHQGGQQSVDEDELVLRPGSHSPLSRPSRQPSLMPLVPQWPDLSNEFSDHIRRQPRDPVLRHDQLTHPSPHHAQFNEHLSAEPRPTVHEVVKAVAERGPILQMGL
ncbi:hypothetical protein WKI71_00070 [Streptomyces sp. MS1.AVA.1]|uniref:Uncharacterized protein n=1 Tax=Streptomyces machairae TaxID=3134109 RepID=A0ABU8UF27_9ACTN